MLDVGCEADSAVRHSFGAAVVARPRDGSSKRLRRADHLSQADHDRCALVIFIGKYAYVALLIFLEEVREVARALGPVPVRAEIEVIIVLVDDLGGGFTAAVGALGHAQASQSTTGVGITNAGA